MNYFEFIKNDDKSKDEIKEYYQNQYPKYYDLKIKRITSEKKL